MPKNMWYNYLIGGVLGLLLFISLNPIFLIPISRLGYIKDINSFIGVNLSFFPLIISILVIIKFYHKRKLVNFINRENSINTKRFLRGFVIWFILQSTTLIYNLIFFKNQLSFNFNPSKFLIFLLLSISLTPIQVASEEFLFRGYLIDFLRSFSKNKLFIILASSLLFALPHLKNPEVKNSTFTFFLIYLTMAITFSYITVKYRGLEYSFGVHLANNLFAINIVNYPDSPLPSSPIFLLSNGIAPLPTLLQTLLFSALLVIIIKKLEKNN
ncbi:CPBP family intramembrane metalloprotease [Thiospirochaeta perfilievii]|uniref:CPBP family intramembrane metalloprotease n=1 Tax=Thiospirochaeta perfilievii TaxID=252967 RepID=A0A5C1QDA8_9SPIO|nr:type II CAAX endopeptidase family protein [Thiospirochaeta perfilievii]QEN04959.1 CPBP family intramembrane metalloprotease [Thiospirochaeta perfilievii]